MNKEIILETLEKQKGVLLAEPAIVYRETYAGRDIIAKNSRFEKGYTDERGYVPVEWWVMSLTQAENAIKKKDEGLTKIKLIDGNSILLQEASEIAENEIFGNYKKAWPLTKILDIGGVKKKTSFGNEEVPPIPPHVHGGDIIEGKATGSGKLEAYFFPPLDVKPYNQRIQTITRLGLKPWVTKEEFIEKLKNFGQDDSMYELLEVYDIKPYSGWTIPAGTVHAPGPWVTFEIQLPQDDFNLLGFRLGEKIENETERTKESERLLTKGLKDEEDVLNQVIDWETSTAPDFKQKYYRDIKILEQNESGIRYRIFFAEFYGEGWEIEKGKTFKLQKQERPIAGIIWSGKGKLNGNEISVEGIKEFLITPNHEIEIENKGDDRLIIFTVQPIMKRIDTD